MDTSRRVRGGTIVFMNRTVLRTAPAALACGWLMAGCNSVVPPAPGASATSETVTIEHTSLRSRTSVYESALKACKQRGHDQAIFRTQSNEDPQRAPATGPQLSTFTCR